MAAVSIWPLINSRILHGDAPMVVIYGPCVGGQITNPASATDQTLAVVEPLYIDLVNDAIVGQSQTCFAIQPGQTYTLPQDFAGTATVNAASTGHTFSGFVIHEAASYRPLDGEGDTGRPFPLPAGQISVIAQAIPSYLYQQYSDDDDLQAFVDAFNKIVGWYINWFAHLNPADYTQRHIESSLLDWVAAGLYGMRRTELPLGLYRSFGALNTYTLNQWPLNKFDIVPPSDYQLTTDDIFRRILTWHLYKGDGDVFSIRWLKRRIKRFLSGVDGTGGDTRADPEALAPDHTYEVSVTFGANNEVNINFLRIRRVFRSGALFGTFLMNQRMLNEYNGEEFTFDLSPLAPTFMAAVNAGVLELPFQYKFIVNIN
jgi:hypothetical protein